MQKKSNGASALVLAVLRRPQVADGRTLTMVFLQTNPAAPKKESCGYAASRRLRLRCQRCLPEHRRGTPQPSCGAAQAGPRGLTRITFRAPRVGVCLCAIALHSQFVSSTLAHRSMSLLLALSMYRTSRSNKKIFHRRNNVRPFASSARFGERMGPIYRGTASLHVKARWADCLPHHRHRDQFSICHISAVSKLWRSVRNCYRSN